MRRKGQPGGAHHSVPLPKGRASVWGGRWGWTLVSKHLHRPSNKGGKGSRYFQKGWGAKRINQGSAQHCSLFKNLQITGAHAPARA